MIGDRGRGSSRGYRYHRWRSDRRADGQGGSEALRNGLPAAQPGRTRQAPPRSAPAPRMPRTPDNLPRRCSPPRWTAWASPSDSWTRIGDPCGRLEISADAGPPGARGGGARIARQACSPLLRADEKRLMKAERRSSGDRHGQAEFLSIVSAGRRGPGIDTIRFHALVAVLAAGKTRWRSPNRARVGSCSTGR